MKVTYFRFVVFLIFHLLFIKTTSAQTVVVSCSGTMYEEGASCTCELSKRVSRNVSCSQKCVSCFNSKNKVGKVNNSFKYNFKKITPIVKGESKLQTENKKANIETLPCPSFCD